MCDGLLPIPLRRLIYLNDLFAGASPRMGPPDVAVRPASGLPDLTF